MSKELVDQLRLDFSIKARNGVDFTLAAAVIWMLISYVWTLDYSAYSKSVLTFMVGPLLLPLAFLFSRLLNTTWVLPDNALQPLGLRLNFAQMFYFSFLVFILLRSPDHFVMGYAIITGAHLFPYAWLYNTRLYGVFPGLISIGVLLIALNVPVEQMFLVPLFTAVALFVLSLLLYADSNRKRQQRPAQT